MKRWSRALLPAPTSPESLERGTLDTLMGRLAAGDRGAFTAAYQQLRGPLTRLCHHLLPDPSDAADAFQEAMQKIFERAPSQYDPTRPALPWALAIAAWECRTVKRRRQRRREDLPGELHDPRPPAPHTTEDTFVQKDLSAAALSALSTLSPVDQQTLLATFWEEAPPLAGATFRKRRERARDRLRGAFRRLYGLD